MTSFDMESNGISVWLGTYVCQWYCYELLMMTESPKWNPRRKDVIPLKYSSVVNNTIVIELGVNEAAA